MRELSDRSRNLLVIVQSMARHTMRGAPDVHTLVTRLCEPRAALSACHCRIVRSQLLFAQSVLGVRVFIESPPLVARLDAAQAFAMAVNEPVSNALAFGVLSSPHERVDVSWRVDRQLTGALRFEWRETFGEGDGPGQGRPRTRGFGSVPIERMAARSSSSGLRSCCSCSRP